MILTNSIPGENYFVEVFLKHPWTHFLKSCTFYALLPDSTHQWLTHWRAIKEYDWNGGQTLKLTGSDRINPFDKALLNGEISITPFGELYLGVLPASCPTQLYRQIIDCSRAENHFAL